MTVSNTKNTKRRPKTKCLSLVRLLSGSSLLDMQRGTALLFLGIGTILAGILSLKLTDINACWAIIALGAVVGATGGISISQRARA